MRLLSQNIAQRANKEDGELGKFWQARFRGVRLLDDTAILACAAYVDLNPIRAAMAETLEDSDFTSAQKRANDLRSQFADGSVQFSEKAGGPQVEAKSSPEPGKSRGQRASEHLAPVELGESSEGLGACVDGSGARCSNKGFLPMSTADYLDLLDWTARQVRSNKRGSTPPALAPLFERLGISAEVWCKLVQNFGRLFSVVAGQPQRIDEHRSSTNSHRFRARTETRELLTPA